MSKSNTLQHLVVFPIFTYGPEPWMWLKEWYLQCKRQSLNFVESSRCDGSRQGAHSCEIGKALNLEPLLRIERSEIRWSGHVTRKIGEGRPAGYSHGKRAQRSTKDQMAWPTLAWSILGMEPAELSEIADNREVFQVLLGSPPAALSEGKAGMKMNEQKDIGQFHLTLKTLITLPWSTTQSVKLWKTSQLKKTRYSYDAHLTVVGKHLIVTSWIASSVQRCNTTATKFNPLIHADRTLTANTKHVPTILYVFHNSCLNKKWSRNFHDVPQKYLGQVRGSS